jgi:hypothetical protein
MIEIVAVRIGSTITNDRKIISAAAKVGMISELLDRRRMQFMADADLGRRWENLAISPTLLLLDDDYNAQEAKP